MFFTNNNPFIPKNTPLELLSRDMKKLQITLLNISILISLLLLSIPTSVTAADYDQPAFISNIYFTYKVAQKGKGIKPDLIVNAIRANSTQTAIQLVVDLVGDKGTHKLEVEILNMKELRISDPIKFSSWTAAADNMYFKLTTNIKGSFPDGGVFFKVYDTLDAREKALIGVFRMMTVK